VGLFCGSLFLSIGLLASLIMSWVSWWVSFVGFFCGSLLWVSFVGLFCGSLWWISFMGLFFLYRSLMRPSSVMSLIISRVSLWVFFVGLFCGSRSWVSFMGLFCGTLFCLYVSWRISSVMSLIMLRVSCGSLLWVTFLSVGLFMRVSSVMSLIMSHHPPHDRHMIITKKWVFFMMKLITRVLFASSSQKSGSFLWWDSSRGSFLPHHHKKTHRRDLQKRPTKETCQSGCFWPHYHTKDPQKRPTKKTQNRDLQNWFFLASSSQKTPTEETHRSESFWLHHHKKDPQKKPTKDEEPQKRPTKVGFFGLVITKNTNRRKPQKWVFFASSSHKRTTTETHKSASLWLRGSSSSPKSGSFLWWNLSCGSFLCRAHHTKVGLVCLIITKKTHRRNWYMNIFLVMRLIIIRKKTHRRDPQKRPTKETHKRDSSYHAQKWVMSAVRHMYICVCLNAASASHHHLRGYYIHCSCVYVNISHHYLRAYYMYVYMCMKIFTYMYDGDVIHTNMYINMHIYNIHANSGVICIYIYTQMYVTSTQMVVWCGYGIGTNTYACVTDQWRDLFLRATWCVIFET